MSDKENKIDRAFPCVGFGLMGDQYLQEGMSKRFYAACAVMQGMLGNIELLKCNAKVAIEKKRNPDEFLAFTAFTIADELLKQESNE